MPLRVMPYGLAVKAHDSDVARGYSVRGQEGLDRLGMGLRYKGFRLRERAWPLAAPGEIGGLRHRAPNVLPLVLGIGPIERLPETADLLAVGIDERDVDPIVGRAAHQADRRHPGHWGQISGRTTD